MGRGSERMTGNYINVLPEGMKEVYQEMIGEPIENKWEVKE